MIVMNRLYRGELDGPGVLYCVHYVFIEVFIAHKVLPSEFPDWHTICVCRLCRLSQKCYFYNPWYECLTLQFLTRGSIILQFATILHSMVHYSYQRNTWDFRPNYE